MESEMKIGIISDTHKKVEYAKVALDMLLENGADFIIHAGDIVEVAMLDLLESCGKKYIAVYGNNDAHLLQHHKKYNLVQEPYYFQLAQTKFKLMHLPLHLAPDAEVIIYGHTHHFEATMSEGTLFLNPGEICARKKPLTEALLLEVVADRFEVTRYFKEPKKSKFKTAIFSFARKK